MNILIGSDPQWSTVRFVALIDGGQVVRASTLHELAQHLYALGIDEHDVQLASPHDGDHAMSLSQHAEFRAAWLSAAAANRA